MRKLILILFFGLLISVNAFSQIQVQGEPLFDNINGDNPFLDASTSFDKSLDPSAAGKGLVFPRMDLTNWTFFVTRLFSGSAFYRGALDGMIVYNTETGETPTTGNNPSVSTSVTPGFYFFYNPDGADDMTITNGKWVRLNDSNISTMPSGATNPAPANSNDGDVFFNTTTGNFYFYNGTEWVSVSGTPSGASLPLAGDSRIGDTFYDTSVSPAELKIFNGTNWVTVGASVADGSITNAKLQGDDDGTLAQGTSGQLLTATGDGQFKWTDAGSLPSGTDTPAQPVAEGTMFYETDTDILWVSDGANWVELQSAGSTLVSGTEPLNPSAGDVYYNTSDNNLYYYNGTDWVMLNGVATGTVTPTDGTGTAGETYYDTTTNTYYVYGSDGTWHAMGDMTKSVYDANNDNIVDVAATVSDNGITNVKIAAGAITDTKLQGTGGGTLVPGQDGQVLTSDGSGTFKWTTVSSAVTGNLYQGTVADVTGFNGLVWATISSATDVGTSIPATICSLDAANYTWIAFPKAWGTQNFFYKYGGSVYAVFDGFEKRIIPAATTGTVDYQVWLFKTTPDIAVDLIVSNN